MSADGRGVVSHVGARLLADVAEATGLVHAFEEAVGGRRVRRSAHAPGRVLADVAVMLADGGEAIADLAGLRNQPGLFGQVASPATCWRVLDSVDADTLAGLKQARAVARERAWLLRAEAGRPLPTVVCARSDPAGAGDRHRRHFGDLPLREGTGGADLQARVRLPPDAGLVGQHRRGTGRGVAAGERGRERRRRPHRRHRRRGGADPRSLTGTARRSWFAPTAPAAPGSSWPTCVACASSGGWRCRSRSGSGSPTPSRTRSDGCPRSAWTVAVDAAGQPRPVDETGLPVAQVADLTGLLADLQRAGWPVGMRVLVRRERPHPGAQTHLDGSASTAGATSVWRPTPRPGSWPGWKPGTAPTPGSRTGSRT